VAKAAVEVWLDHGVAMVGELAGGLFDHPSQPGAWWSQTTPERAWVARVVRVNAVAVMACDRDALGDHALVVVGAWHSAVLGP
jgi:hypothetical protein